MKNYDIKEVIGDGLSCKAFLAVFIPDSLYICLKVIKKCKKFNKMIQREVIALRKTNYPYIVSLIQAIETENYVWLSLEYCSGGNL